MINKVILTGRLTRDVEIRKTGSGKSVTNFTLAVNRLFKSEGQPEADFINCIAWDKKADIMAQYLHQGSLIGVEGRIQTGSYQDKETGKNVYTTDIVCDNIVFLESKAQSQENQKSSEQSPRVNQNASQPKTQVKEEPVLDITADDLPF